MPMNEFTNKCNIGFSQKVNQLIVPSLERIICIWKIIIYNAVNWWRQPGG